MKTINENFKIGTQYTTLKRNTLKFEFRNNERFEFETNNWTNKNWTVFGRTCYPFEHENNHLQIPVSTSDMQTSRGTIEIELDRSDMQTNPDLIWRPFVKIWWTSRICEMIEARRRLQAVDFWRSLDRLWRCLGEKVGAVGLLTGRKSLNMKTKFLFETTIT